MDHAKNLILDYYNAFNRQDMSRFLTLLSDDVIHDINQGRREIGKSRFNEFMQKMNRNYKEELKDIVVMANEFGTRAAAEFTVYGTYLQSDLGLPTARGQTYKVAAGAFFEISNGLITRITNYYNLEDWITQVK
ncbi:MAG: nuclear transport factor 2 family protein [Proteobacteria bacterium]|nr:nuclear transport factor 2 family protein [Pseudomonadota bacterium]